MLALPLEHVVGDLLVGVSALRSIRASAASSSRGRLPLGIVISVGRIIAEPSGVTQVAAASALIGLRRRLSSSLFLKSAASACGRRVLHGPGAAAAAPEARKGKHGDGYGSAFAGRTLRPM